MTGTFTVRRTRLLAERVAAISDLYLDVMEHAGGPVDLVKWFAHPIAALTICELLGVPDADRDRFQCLVTELATDLGDPDLPRSTRVEAGVAAFEETRDYMRNLVAAKRTEPADDLLADLTRADVRDEELARTATLLLIGGFEISAHMLTLSAFGLLRDPEQCATLRTDPERAAEELLRYVTVPPTTTRFTHGIHGRLGRQLAGLELRIALPALITRFPGLRLTVPAEEVRMRPAGAGGRAVQWLPVTWQAGQYDWSSMRCPSGSRR
ncbi:hypothetical protein ACIP5Y_40245 [Nocardia sp. NPDC088792]|uniref:hypothetical protein n=1 Tax=Nocardia sp. NPDC088792 TaxID=3364332 RepID=UPI00380BCC5C